MIRRRDTISASVILFSMLTDLMKKFEEDRERQHCHPVFIVLAMRNNRDFIHTRITLRLFEPFVETTSFYSLTFEMHPVQLGALHVRTIRASRMLLAAASSEPVKFEKVREFKFTLRPFDATVELFPFLTFWHNDLLPKSQPR